MVLTARDAANRGADIRTRTRAVQIRQADGIWHVTVEDKSSGERSTISARALVNAGGPWVEDVLASGAGVNARAKVRLVQGSHIVVRKLYDHDRAYMFQNSDGRIVFVIPYQDDFTLIGTTDRDYDGDPAKVKASAEEIEYLCNSVSEYLAKPVKPADVVWTYAGVRPLYDDGASEAKAATRDYVFELDTARRRAAAVDLWRQDHHLSPPRRGGAGAAVALLAQRQGRARAGPRNRHCPAAISTSRRSRR